MVNILIAEDEPKIASFMTKGLNRAGYSTHVARDGQEVLLRLKSGEFDLLLLDLGLPILDGWAVLEELNDQTSPIPVIVVTALADRDIEKKLTALGAKDLIRKPFRFNQLLTSVRNHT